MFCLPLQLSDDEYALYVFLESENLERMHAYDPAVVTTRALGESFARLRCKEVVVGYAAAEDLATVMGMCREGKPVEALRHMTRGFRYRPDQGDHDGPYLSLSTPKKKLQ